MEQKRSEKQEPKILIEGAYLPLSESQTGKFGITKREFQNLIINILAETRSGSRPQRALFKLLLKRMGIRTHSKPKDEYLKDYLKSLREMKENGLVEFVSGKTKLNVRLPRVN